MNELSNVEFIDLTGVDSAENMIKMGMREYLELNLVANPHGKLPFEENTFDAVILFGVLICIPDELFVEMTDHSYATVVGKLPKYKQKKLLGEV